MGEDTRRQAGRRAPQSPLAAALASLAVLWGCGPASDAPSRVETQAESELTSEVGASPPPAAREPEPEPEPIIVEPLIIDEAADELALGAAPRESSAPPYPWPPEPPSSIASLDPFVQSARGQRLGDLSDQLAAALSAADYPDFRFYSAPGGFVLVTRLEEIAEDGTPLPGRTRYRLPSDPREQSFADYLRGLFLEAPPGLWRYVAIVVSDQSVVFDAGDALSSDEAVTRLSAGATRLDGALADAPFTDAHQVTALIYEFRKARADEAAAQVAPGRIPPDEHLARAGIAPALLASFGGP